LTNDIFKKHFINIEELCVVNQKDFSLFEPIKVFNMISLDQIDFKEKTAIIRVDFNVPLDEKNNVTDDTRIRAALPTIRYILDNGGACVLMSHLGRPKGREAKYSLIHIKQRIEEVLEQSILFSEDCVGKQAENFSSKLKPGEVLLLENLRFYNEEIEGDRRFSEELSKHGSIYVNDAFGTAHRAHSSTTLIAEFFKLKCSGKLLEKEIKAIDKVTNSGEKPVLAIIGGAKISSKITIIENILEKIDDLIIGGGMAYTFIKAKGGKIGQSLCEEDYMEFTFQLLRKAKDKNVKIHLPIDVIAADNFSNTANTKVFKIDSIPDNWMGLDSGPETLLLFKEIVSSSKTILWNGPLGVFEFPNFAKGTIGLGMYIAEATKNGAFSLVGGGDSVAAVKQFGFEKKVSYVSTGGGAMLESLEGLVLPAIQALENEND